MKNFLIALISFVLGGVVTYFAFPRKVKEQTSVTPSTNSQDTIPKSGYATSSWPKFLKDSLPNIVKILKQKFSSDTISVPPVLNFSQNLSLASYYSILAKRAPIEIKADAARNEINAYQGVDEVRTVWVDIRDVISILGAPESAANPNGLDGFRFYLGKAINHPRPEAEGKITLIMVATKTGANGIHEDVFNEQENVYSGIENKFDPCPPPSNGCPGTLLRRIP